MESEVDVNVLLSVKSCVVFVSKYFSTLRDFILNARPTHAIDFL